MAVKTRTRPTEDEIIEEILRAAGLEALDQPHRTEPLESPLAGGPGGFCGSMLAWDHCHPILLHGPLPLSDIDQFPQIALSFGVRASYDVTVVTIYLLTPSNAGAWRLRHRRGHCTFHTMLKEYQLKDPVLARFAQIVDAADVVQEG